ncbi:UDP galactose transporter-like protein [Dunaliella salina]|uniref:UDP galactose transporter-like protein n=1 Tax=Dunaliella salina TaxID=3046 RepID=A0ABQ7G6G6_DUNSA|nr:UDP galactose transporter-like protein [Dunaliella salina]|eukprot:KAF5830184.1 UDP galactose transporter-like protein [Dunaliella salina]
MAAVPDTKDAEAPLTAGTEAQEEPGQGEFKSPLPSSWADMLAWSCQQIKDLLGLAVVTGSLLIYGVLQERIMTIGFGPHSELFGHSIFLVLCNRLVTCMAACAYVMLTEPNMNAVAPLSSYAAVSCTNVIATSCQYEALKYVSFAIQTLAKSAKALPVMIWGTIYMNKQYKPMDYILALTITAGCTIFVLNGPVASRTVVDTTDPGYLLIGAALMVVYLAVDGLTSTWQDSMFHTHKMSVCHQVMYTTAFSTSISFMGTVGTNQLIPSFMFLMRNPDALWYILALCASSAAMQVIISYTIKRYGSLAFATVMTTRQFFSILVSSLVFWTPLMKGQWLGVSIVFGAMYLKLLQQSTG